MSDDELRMVPCTIEQKRVSLVNEAEQHLIRAAKVLETMDKDLSPEAQRHMKAVVRTIAEGMVDILPLRDILVIEMRAARDGMIHFGAKTGI